MCESRTRKFTKLNPFGDRYDRTSGGLYDGNEWRKYRVVPRTHPLRSCISACFNRSGSKRAKGLLDFQGRRGITSVIRWSLRPVIFGVDFSVSSEQTSNWPFGSGDCPVGWGSSTRRGGGRKICSHSWKFVFLGFKGSLGLSGNFAGMSPNFWGCSKSLC